MLTDLELTRMSLSDAWYAGGEQAVEMTCESFTTDRLREVVVDAVFAMAAGTSGIPAWLRTAERVLDSRR